MNPVYSQFAGAGEACTGGQKKRQPCGAAFFMYYLPCGGRAPVGLRDGRDRLCPVK